MIFLDTSGLYALADNRDQCHSEAVRTFHAIQESGEPVVTNSYVIVETAALIQNRVGLESALRFLREAEAFDVEWVSQDIHAAAVEELERRGTRSLSLVDATSFLTMNTRGITSFFGFDKHFEDAGFHRAP